MQFEELAGRALDDAAFQGASYADVRFEDARAERIEVRNGEVVTLSDNVTTGYGMRALVDGAWGFAAGDELTTAGVADPVADVASPVGEIARASASVGTARLGQAPTDAQASSYATEFEIDPDRVSLEQRVDLLVAAEYALHLAPQIRAGRASLDLWRTKKEFFSTIGSRIEQDLRQSGSAIHVLAVGDGEAQDRGWPGDRGLYLTGGWEVIARAGLIENAPRIAEEAVALLSAPQSPAGVKDIVLGGSQVSLQIHESCGHAAELDRVLGWEANFSGTSFLLPELIGKLRYGSPIVNIVIDNTLPGGFATCGYDDEGSPSGNSDIVREGILTGFPEMSRDYRPADRSRNQRVRARRELAARADDSHVQLEPASRDAFGSEQLIAEV